MCSREDTFRRHLKTCTNGRRGSSAEVQIKDILNSMGIAYIFDKEHYQLAEFAGANLKFYFIFTINDQQLVIEYDGMGHYKPVDWAGDKKKSQKIFDKPQTYDSLRTSFAKKITFQC